MKSMRTFCSEGLNFGDRSRWLFLLKIKSKLVAAVVGFFALGICGFGPSVKAQSATLLATNQNIYAGANFNGIYTNSQLRATLSGTGTSTVTLSVSGAPAGVTITFSGAGFPTANPFNFTNSLNPIWYTVAVTNVAKGIYPLTFTLSGAASASATVNLIVGPRWINTTPAGDVKWSTGANWSTGVAPGNGDAVIFQDAGNTNYVDTSVSVDSLTFIPLLSGTNQNMLIAPGQTLSVVGTNGFAANVDSFTANSKTYTLNIYGSGASLVATNPSANFFIGSDNSSAAGTTVNMTNLDNFSTTANRFGLGDWTMAQQGGVGANLVVVSFAKTNAISAAAAGNYNLTNLFPTFSISMLLNGDPFNNGSASTINLGIYNTINAESFAFAQDRAGSANNILRFNPTFVTGVLPYVSFRNTNGGRMNLVGVGVDSGTSNPGSNARGQLNFTGGIVDMLVDTMWLGRDRAMSATTNSGALGQGVLTFNAGIIDVNYLRAGYQAYSNNSTAQGQINVGGSSTNTAILTVNTNLELGYTAGDFSTTPGSIASGGNGQVTINTNGIVRANQVTVGTYSANNFITINNGGVLEVSNSLASSGIRMGKLTVNVGGGLTLHRNGANTLVYVTNLVASSGVINIATDVGGGTFCQLISYVPGFGETASFVVGSMPAGKNGTIFNNTITHTIDLTLTTGTPKTLLWQGYVNNQWDNSTANWLDTSTLLHTNFSTGDSVVFDDSASFAAVNVTEDVVPRQASGFNGMAMTNNLLDYTFSGAGGIRGAASFVKTGSRSVTINNYSEIGAQVIQGQLTGNGTIGSVAVSPGATCSLLSGGTILGGLTCGGMTVNAGTVQGALAMQTLAVMTNAAGGMVQGPLTTANGSFIYNAGTFSGLGSATIATNAIFINAGSLANGGNNAGSLAVSGTFEDMGLDAGTVVNLSTLTINGGGTFIPGGDGIGTTKVINDGISANNGRVLLLTGSTNIFKVNVGGSPANTLLTSGYMSFGPNQNTLIQNGGTIKLVQIGGPAYAVGQSYTLVQNNFGGAPFNVGLNTTNSLSVIDPSVPSSGLAWDLSQLIGGGVIGIKTIATTATNIVFNTALTQTISTNVPPITNNVIVVGLSWPTDYTGWILQQQQNTLDVGLSTNWTSLAVSQFTNNMVLTNAVTTNTAVFYRMVSP